MPVIYEPKNGISYRVDGNAEWIDLDCYITGIEVLPEPEEDEYIMSTFANYTMNFTFQPSETLFHWLFIAPVKRSRMHSDYRNKTRRRNRRR